MKMNNPKVSIIIPVYNVEKYIERCVRSILSQDYFDLEVIFVDDCSPDHSSEIIKRVAADYPERNNQVIILRHEKNLGVSVARNTALDVMTGDFVMFVDADDYLFDGAVRKLVVCQQENDSDITSGGFVLDHGDRQEVDDGYKYSSVDELLQRCCGSVLSHNHFARIFRAKLLDAPRIRYRPGVKIGEDWIFFVEVLLRANSLAYINEPIYYYDFTNQSSAMHNIMRADRVCSYMLSDLWALNEIRLLVANRDDKYTNACLKLMSERLSNGLHYATLNNSYRMFNQLSMYVSIVKPLRQKWPELMRRRNIMGHQFFIIWWLDNCAIRFKVWLLKILKSV